MPHSNRLNNKGTYFKLLNDVDLTGGIKNRTWTISDFNGYLWGNNKTVKLSIDLNGKERSSDNDLTNVGLFAVNNGTINSLNLNCNIVAKFSNNDRLRCIGGICGVNKGNISSCTVTGLVSAYDVDIRSHKTSTGGITGWNEGWMCGIKNHAEVRGYGDVAGIAGTCYSGSIICADNHGWIRYWFDDSTLSSSGGCAGVPSVTNRSVGGIVGWFAGGSVSYSTNHNAVAYETTKKIDNGNLHPSMGQVIGYMSGGTYVYDIRNIDDGWVYLGELQVKKFLWIVVYDQMENAGDRLIGHAE